MKRYIFAVFLLFITLIPADAQSIKWNKSYSDYFSTWGEVAVQQMVQYRIPASITLAQGVLESGAGKSELARKANNHFGIKCNGWTGRKSYHDDDERGECFRAYDNAYQSYVDHSVFLTNSPRYRRLFDLKRTDYKGWAKGLKACGYATSPTYATRLIEIIETYGLHRYDVGKGFDKQRIEQMHQSADQRQVFTFNNNYYVRARRGDTFRRIADDVDVSYRRLAKFNERDKNDTLEEGEIIWLQKKRRKAPKEFKNRPHRVEPGESMYIISQRYGIRLKNLYKMNGLSPDYVIQTGDLLRVR
ncbi:MAG: glucosaminidase domain-containing protein [Prevotella sp.]|nr:glucosaminidase domain-containing protein [Prevotella sp.]